MKLSDYFWARLGTEYNFTLTALNLRPLPTLKLREDVKPDIAKIKDTDTLKIYSWETKVGDSKLTFTDSPTCLWWTYDENGKIIFLNR